MWYMLLYMNINMDNTFVPKPQLQPIISEVGNNSTIILDKSLWLGNIKHLNEPPKELYVRGNIFWKESINNKNNSQKFICFVGARKCTQYGREITRRLIRELIPYNVVIVSGLALGIDSEAHSSAISYGIPTVAFPGSGLATNYIYPRLHLDLAEKIIKSGGALISEYSEYTRSQPWMFPMRNRLMAGASSIVIVVEAEKVSGTRTTVDTALSIGTSVGAVPGPITSIMSYGTNELIKSGAYTITTGKDIVEIVGAVLKENKDESRNVTEHGPGNLYKNSENYEYEIEQKIISELNISSCTPAYLSHKLKLPISKIIHTLTKLCIEGVITLGNDGSYKI